MLNKNDVEKFSSFFKTIENEVFDIWLSIPQCLLNQRIRKPLFSSFHISDDRVFIEYHSMETLESAYYDFPLSLLWVSDPVIYFNKLAADYAKEEEESIKKAEIDEYNRIKEKYGLV